MSLNLISANHHSGGAIWTVGGYLTLTSTSRMAGSSAALFWPLLSRLLSPLHSLGRGAMWCL